MSSPGSGRRGSHTLATVGRPRQRWEPADVTAGTPALPGKSTYSRADVQPAHRRPPRRGAEGHPPAGRATLPRPSAPSRRPRPDADPARAGGAVVARRPRGRRSPGGRGVGHRDERRPATRDLHRARVLGDADRRSRPTSATTIADVGRARGLPDRAIVIALATAQQESRLRNLDYGDRDSLGLFQQRPSQGWGTPAQVQDPVYAAGIFYDRLVQVPGWETGRLTEVSPVRAAQRLPGGLPAARGDGDRADGGARPGCGRDSPAADRRVTALTAHAWESVLDSPTRGKRNSIFSIGRLRASTA